MPGADVAPAAPAGAAGADAQPAAPKMPGWMSMIMRMALMYFIMNFFSGNKSAAPKAVEVTTADGTTIMQTLPPHTNMYIPGQAMDLSVYLAPASDTRSIHFEDSSNLLWAESSLTFDASPLNERTRDVNLTLTDYILRNGSLYAHVFLTEPGRSANPDDRTFDFKSTVHAVHPIIKFRAPRKLKKLKSLLGEESDAQQEQSEQQVAAEEEQESSELVESSDSPSAKPYVAYWTPQLHIQFVDDHTAFPAGQIPPPFGPHYRINPSTNQYFPVVYFNEFWLLKEKLIPINKTLSETPIAFSSTCNEQGEDCKEVAALPLNLYFGPIAMWKWQVQLSLDQGFAMQQTMGTMKEDGSEMDEFKRMMLETNPVLLGVTFTVSLLHSVFEFLAFKNDIAFWKNNKSLEGVSVRSLFWNCGCQIVIFLYLLDNDTSWMVLLSSGAGAAIELWKLRKAATVSLDWNNKYFGLIPRLHVQDKESYASRTKEFDDQAMRYLSYAMYPLLVGYAIYSLYTDKHKSWYSFILQTMVGAIHMFGFLLMVPSVIINYRLKSVAHMPWRTMVYKALNTFIDDLFSFVVKMPTLHRISCFRDDIIFFIFLYQKWIYKVDLKRANEFGQSFEGEQPAQEAIQEAAPVDAAAAAPIAAAPAEQKQKQEPAKSKKAKKKD